MKKRWYRLDNTAKIFPSIVSERLTTVFRISAQLTTTVDKQFLQRALDETLLRYPYFQVHLKKGIFWSYLQESKVPPLVELEREQPCRKMSKWFDQKYLFRVLFYNKRVSVEFSHILTDGTGALLFITKLITTYSSLIDSRGINTESLTPEMQAREEEDSYLSYYKQDIPPPRGGGVSAFHLPGPLLPKNRMRILSGMMPVQEVKKVAKEKGVTITELLITTYLWTLQEFNKQNRRKRYLKPLRLMVPVNLRNLYPSDSIRNFFLSVLPEIDLRLGDYEFDEICQKVHSYMQVEINEKYINQQISKNVSTERNPFIRLIPQLLKAPIERVIYNVLSNSKHSGVATNLGIVKLPDSVATKVEGFRFIPNPNPVTKINFGVVSFNDTMVLSFGSLTQYRLIEKIFFCKLRSLGVPITIETNE